MNPALRILAGTLAAWMALLPSVSLAAQGKQLSGDAARNEARRIAAVKQMRAETGADPDKLVEHEARVEKIEQLHLLDRLAGLGRQEEGLRSALTKLGAHPSEQERATLVGQVRANATALGSSAKKIEAITRKHNPLPPKLAAKIGPALKLSKQLAAVKGLEKPNAGAALGKLNKLIAKVPAAAKRQFAAPAWPHKLTAVTPHVQQASREDLRRSRPLLASSQGIFAAARELQDLADDNLPAPTPQDLLATPEAPLAPQITALATQLQNSPIQIYEYVHNRVQSEPYFGSKKGALGTLFEGSGNDYDQASLLIALLRAAGISSRYEVGQIQMLPRQAMDFTNTDDPVEAVAVMNTIGMPAVANLAADNSVVSVNLDLHPWVRAYVPYTNYRGSAGPGSRSIWVRLDPSIKATNRQPPAFAVGNNVAFNFGNYLSGSTANSSAFSPLQIFEGQLTSYLHANSLSCDSLDKLLPTNAIQPVSLTLLPSELNTTLLNSESVTDALDPYTDYSYFIQLDSGGISPQQSLPATYGQTIALRYVGASNADQQAITTAGSTTKVSPVAVTLQPELVVNGAVVWTGFDIAPGTPQNLNVTVNVPGLPQASMNHTIGAGGIYAIGLAASHPTDAQLAQVKQAIATTQAAVNGGTASADDLDEASAQALALTYLHHIDRDEKRIFGYAGDVGVKDVTEIVAGHYVNSSTFFGIPVGETPGSWRVDVQREANTPFSQTSGVTSVVNVNELAGFQGSHWENRLFQEVFNSSAISTTNGCQLAVAGGGTLLTLTVPGTSSQLVGYDVDAIAEIEGALSAGEVVTVPKTTFANGTHFTNVEVYQILDPADGTALYREGSTFNGAEAYLIDWLLSLVDFSDSSDTCTQCTGSAISLASGNYFFTRTDLTLPAVGIPITFMRAYDSGAGVNGVLGANWWHSYERKLIINGNGSATYVTAEDSMVHQLAFTAPPQGQTKFGGPAGWHLSLVNNGNGYTLTYRDGRSSSFDVNGRLLSDQDLNGNKVTIQRNADTTIHTVTDSTNRVVLTFAYAGGYLTSVTDVAGRVAQFGQTGADLTSATDVLNQTEHYAVDGAHHLIGRTDKNGNQWSVAYDVSGRWDLETDPSGNSMAASYDNSARTTVYTDRRGYSRITTYNSMGNPLTVEDPSGNVTVNTWDTDSKKLTAVDGRGNLTTYAYTSDGLGNIQTISYPDSTTAQWAYGPNSRPTTITSPSSSTTNTYDANGNLKTSKDGFNQTTTYAYLPTGQLQTVLAPGNAVATTFAYNADGTTKTITDPLTAVTTLAYDGAGHLTSLTDPGNHARSMTVDASGHVLTMTDALTNQTTFTYDSEGNRKTLKDPTGVTTTFAYDALNRLSSTTDPAGHVSKTAYDPEGNVLTRTDANGNATTFAYDESGRLISTTDALGNVSSQGYCSNLSGTPCQSVDPDGNVTVRVFDSMGRTTQVADGANEVTQTTYLNGVLQKVTDARGNATSYSISYGRTTGYSTPNDAITYGFDARGNRTSVAYSGETTSYTYDANNRLLTEKNPLNFTTTYTYNLDGTRATRTDANGHKTTYGYDANKRLTSVTFADTTSYTFAYDSRGHRTTEQSPSVTRTLTYNNLGQLATALDGLTTKTITYAYDAVGNRTSILYDGLTTAYAYDADRRLTTLTDPTGEVTSMTYDPAGNRTQLAQGNGVVTSYSYDQANRVAKIASPIQSFAYTYDQTGNPYLKTYQDGTSETTTYDKGNRLTGITHRDNSTAGWTYSDETINGWSAGGTQYQFGTVSSFNQTTAITSAIGTTNAYTYTFDNNGNRLTQALQLPGSNPKPPLQTTTYTWNDDDRMSGVTLPSTATNSYGYDANGIRVNKRDSSGNVNYLIDPQTKSILATYDAVAGTRLTTYDQNPQRIDEVLSYQVNALKYYPHADMLGSVYAVSDVTTKAIATWTYDVYGTRTQASGTLSYQFGFTGREHDPDTGLIYSRQRYYDPAVGQWTTNDRLSIATAGQLETRFLRDSPSLRAPFAVAPPSLGAGIYNSSEYAYVSARPTAGSDPSGLIVLPGPGIQFYIDLAAQESPSFAQIMDEMQASRVNYNVSFGTVQTDPGEWSAGSSNGPFLVPGPLSCAGSTDKQVVTIIIDPDGFADLGIQVSPQLILAHEFGHAVGSEYGGDQNDETIALVVADAFEFEAYGPYGPASFVP